MQKLPEKNSPSPELLIVEDLRRKITAAIEICDAGLLRAESSQSQFVATRVCLIGRREALTAVLAHLDGAPQRLDELTKPG